MRMVSVWCYVSASRGHRKQGSTGVARHHRRHHQVRRAQKEVSEQSNLRISTLEQELGEARLQLAHLKEETKRLGTENREVRTISAIHLPLHPLPLPPPTPPFTPPPLLR